MKKTFFMLVKEGIYLQIRSLMKDYQSLNKRFPILTHFFYRF
jgi:hypothetical protein